MSLYSATYHISKAILQELCSQACSKWSLTKVAVMHKIGLCPVGETSVVIAVSSTHRLDALQVLAHTLPCICVQ